MIKEKTMLESNLMVLLVIVIMDAVFALLCICMRLEARALKRRYDTLKAYHENAKKEMLELCKEGLEIIREVSELSEQEHTEDEK